MIRKAFKIKLYILGVMINSHVDFICYAQICRFQYFFRLLMGCYRNCTIIVYQVNDSISFKLY